tara:strand:+ start:39 stop:467 length:429 start_codon:yes stop_codon:yes gene_type:complete
MNELDIAYIAGLFDGEGCVQYKQYIETKKKHKGPGTRKTKTWRINLEMSMTDELVVKWVHQILGVGTVNVNIKNKSPSSKPHWKKQWRWRCTHRDALYVAKLLWPHAQVKLHKLEQILDHYEIEDLTTKPSADIIYLKERKQ